MSVGGVPACSLIEQHLAHFVKGRPPSELELVWTRYTDSLYYARKGLAINAISSVDLALWDLLGRHRQLTYWNGTTRN